MIRVSLRVAGDLTVRTASGTQAEVRTKAMLEDLSRRLDLQRFVVTTDVVIQEGENAHSHPVLTLGTDYPMEAALLSSFLHEQMHWWSTTCSGAGDARAAGHVEGALETSFPDLPLDPPEGCGTHRSNVIHLHVCWLELEALATLFGAEWATQRVLRRPGYRAIYRAVVEHREPLRQLFDAHGHGLPPSASARP